MSSYHDVICPEEAILMRWERVSEGNTNVLGKIVRTVVLHCTCLQVKDVDLKPGTYRSHLSLPSGLVIKSSSIPKAGAGIWAETPVPKGVRFGPYEGTIVEDSEDAHSGYCWQVRCNSYQTCRI